MTAARSPRLLPTWRLAVALALLLASSLPVVAVGAAEAAGPRPARFSYLPAQVLDVPGGRVAVGADSPGRVLVQHYDPASDTWDAPATLYHHDGVTCGRIDARTSPGGVALLLECDRPFYEDQAPVHSVALVSTDGRAWSQQVLPWEAYRTPAISPSAAYAAWRVSAGTVLWSAAGGFERPRRTTFDGDGGPETLVVTDRGTVSVIGAETHRGRCVVGIHDRTLDGALSTQVVTGIDPGCTDGSLDGVDDVTVVGGSDPVDRFVVSRPDVDAPWRVTTTSPREAPGLRTYGGSDDRRIRVAFPDVTGSTLVAVGSPDRRRILTQVYDADAARWSAPEQIYDHGFPGCASDDEGAFREQPLSIVVVVLHCYPRPRPDGVYPPTADYFAAAPAGRRTVLMSVDGDAWTVVQAERRPVAINGRGDVVAVGDSRGVVVGSPDGVRHLAYRERSRCGFLVPGRTPDELLRVHGARRAPWPTVLQERTTQGWRTVERLHLPSTGSCRRVRYADDSGPTAFFLEDGRRSVDLRVVHRHGGWRAVRSDY